MAPRRENARRAVRRVVVTSQELGKASDNQVLRRCQTRDRWTLEAGGDVMATFVRYALRDGTEVLFESEDATFVRPYRGDAEVPDGGRLADRLRGVAAAADEVSREMRARLAPNEVSLEFGLKVSAEAKAWFFAKAQAEGTIKVTLRWAAGSEIRAAVHNEDSPASSGQNSPVEQP